jgi:hypothetical protein
LDGRDYDYPEWARLSPRLKLEIVERYWDPRRPRLGEATRAAILEAFGAANPHLLEQALATTAYFFNWGWCIAVAVADASVRVPRSFDVLPVVKGIVEASRSGSTAAEQLRSAHWLHRPPPANPSPRPRGRERRRPEKKRASEVAAQRPARPRSRRRAPRGGGRGRGY